MYMKYLARLNPVFSFILLFLVLFQILITVNKAFISDSLIKMIQVMSLVRNNWSSEAIIYPAFSLDPKFLLSPFNDGFIFFNNGRLIGNYPIALSLFYSIFTLIPFSFLPYLNVLFLYAFIRLLYRNSIQIKSIVWIVLGCIVFPLLLDFSENGIFLILGSYGYVYLWKAQEDDRISNWLAGNVLLGLSIWFRLEGILFFIAIQVSVFLLELTKKKFKFANVFQLRRYLGFLVLLILFLGWNDYSYSHILGPRYLATFTQTEKTILNQLQVLVSMLFTLPKAGGFSFGLFFLTPILFFAIIKELRKNIREKLLNFHLAVSCLFIVLVGCTSPNDGITLTGRYFLLAVTPLAFILNQQIESIQSQKFLYRTTLYWNILTSTLVLMISYFAIIEFYKIKSEVNQVNSPITVTTNELISSAYGLELIDKKVVCIRNMDLLPYFFNHAKSEALTDFTIVTVKKVTKYNTEELSLYGDLVKLSTNYGYECENEILFDRIKSRRCVLKK